MSRTVVLCYHALSPDWPATLNVRPDLFERQIDLMLQRGFRGQTFTSAVAEPSESKTLVVTFDDAFRSVLTEALPILDRYGIPATVFAVTGFADSGKPLHWSGIEQWEGGSYEPELAGMGWDELRHLSERGWEIGSHTVTHPHLPELSDAAIAEELGAARAACERELDRPCTSVAYPYGHIDGRVIRAAAAAGYATGAALPAGYRPERPLEWPRVGVWFNDDLSRFKLKVSPRVRSFRRLIRR
jgi:peptidoglycan/xylan/chitin deacetylase (PgdA/CDA1 family)